MQYNVLHHEYAGILESTHKSCNHHESFQTITTHKESHIQSIIAIGFTNTTRFCHKRISECICQANLKTMKTIRNELQKKSKQVVEEMNIAEEI
jgi:ABC-type polar amino acid transport system ATPase subunit